MKIKMNLKTIVTLLVLGAVSYGGYQAYMFKTAVDQFYSAQVQFNTQITGIVSAMHQEEIKEALARQEAAKLGK